MKCASCQQEKLSAEMVADNGRAAKRGWKVGECKSCKRSRQRAAYAYDPTRHKNAVMRSRYGIGIAEYKKLLELQRGVCAICQNPPKRGDLHIDHDHNTNRVRGLLCARCNSAIDWSTQYADEAIVYLKKAEDLQFHEVSVSKRNRTWTRPDKKTDRKAKPKRPRGGVRIEDRNPIAPELAALSTRVSLN